MYCTILFSRSYSTNAIDHAKGCDVVTVVTVVSVVTDYKPARSSTIVRNRQASKEHTLNMAEAVVDGTPMSRFFCHKCSIEIERLLPDYTCPRCASGFIEELESGCNNSSSSMDIPGMDFSDRDDIPSYSIPQSYEVDRDIIEILLGLSNQLPATHTSNRSNGPTDRRRQWTRNTPDARRSDSSRGRQVPMFFEHFINEFLFNLSGGSLGYSVTRQPAVILGDPGDYVWGQDGLDAIVTQLLNQLDGTGPPPLPRKQIDEIPTTNVTQSQIDIKLQCSVCWEDFKLLEPVKQLPCQHVYHAQCIVPWLELHGTCPICRQRLGDQNSAEANQDTVGSSLAALLMAVSESNNTRTSSPPSSGGNNSANDTEGEI